jgi:hypothetical protein
MFPNASPARSQRRTALALQTAANNWYASAGSWFDGTLISVDARLARVDKLIHALRQAGPGYAGRASEFTEERQVIAELRESMLNAHQDREVVRIASYPDTAHEINLVEARAFVRDNIEAAHWPDEMRDRARRHAERVEPRASADLFAETCLRVAATVPRPTVERTASVVQDFDDHHLFL